MKLTFVDLLTKALADWPDEIDLNDLVMSGSESTRYSIRGLYELSEEISTSYIGTVQEVLMRNLHETLYEVLHSTAKNVTRMNMSALRDDAIRKTFEKRLHDGIKISELNCSAEDIQLIGDYFSANEAQLD